MSVILIYLLNLFLNSTLLFLGARIDHKCFKKCGLSVALDGSENAQMSTDGIPNYEIPQRFVEEESDEWKRRIWPPFNWSGDTISCWVMIIIWSNFTLQEKLKLLNWNC